jgi:hypothetical protein
VAELPVGHGRRVDPTELGDLLLEQPQVQAVLADVVPQAPEQARIALRSWFLSSQDDMAKGQRRDVRVAFGATRVAPVSAPRNR